MQWNVDLHILSGRIADDSGGITDDYGVIRNVFCYDGTCADYDVISDVHTRKDDAVTAEPDVADASLGVSCTLELLLA